MKLSDLKCKLKIVFNVLFAPKSRWCHQVEIARFDAREGMPDILTHRGNSLIWYDSSLLVREMRRWESKVNCGIYSTLRSLFSSPTASLSEDTVLFKNVKVVSDDPERNSLVECGPFSVFADVLCLNGESFDPTEVRFYPLTKKMTYGNRILVKEVLGFTTGNPYRISFKQPYCIGPIL